MCPADWRKAGVKDMQGSKKIWVNYAELDIASIDKTRYTYTVSLYEKIGVLRPGDFPNGVKERAVFSEKDTAPRKGKNGAMVPRGVLLEGIPL